MTRIPDFITEVNYPVSITEDPCNGPPWIVQMELAKEPAGDAVITMLTFGWDDVARGYFRPRGLHRGRKARRTPRTAGRLHRLGRFFRNVPGIGDDPGDIIGRKLPGARRVKGRTIRAFEKVVWLVDNRLQQALFWWLVLDVVEEFWYDWTSLLMASEVCNRAFGAAAYRTGDGGGCSSFSAWVGTFTDDTRWEEGGIRMTTAAINLPPGNWKVTAAGIYRNTSGSGGFHGLRLWSGPADDIVWDEQLSAVTPPGLVANNVVTAEIKGPEIVFIMQRCFFASFLGQEQHNIVTGNPLGFVPPPLPTCEKL